MNVIPKLAQGNSLESLFVEWQPAPTIKPQQQAASAKKSKSNDDDDDGELTKKDFVKMIKEGLDGLPNEMENVINNLTNMFRVNSIVGRDIQDLSIDYLNSLLQLKTIAQNKTLFDKSYEKAQSNGALQSPAIYKGNYIYLREDGKYGIVSPDDYFANTNKYDIQTIEDIALHRRLDPNFIYDNISFEIMNDSVGLESFQKHISDITSKLGTSQNTRNGYFSIEGKAQKGLELIASLEKSDQVQALGSITAQGLYEYKIIDKNQLDQINALTGYIMNLLPSSDKAWAAWVQREGNINKATISLIQQYLIGSSTSEHTFDINYKGSMSHAEDNSKSDSKSENPKEGFWRQVQAGQGGTDSSLNFIINDGSMSITGKYYGAVPDIDQNCSLGDYITKSGLGYMITNPKNVTFGNIQLSIDSFDDVMVNTRSGAYAVTLPTKNGKVWIEAVEVYSNFKKDLKKSGFQEGSEQYKSKVKELLKQPEYISLSSIIQTNGTLNPSNSGHFLVLEGITSSKASGISKSGEKQTISEFDSNFIVDSGDDPELYQALKRGLSDKDKGEYEIDSFEFYKPGDWFGFYDKVYKGNIYIPLNTNPINAMNADGNDIKQSTAYEYEAMQQEWNKQNTQSITNSDLLFK